MADAPNTRDLFGDSDEEEEQPKAAPEVDDKRSKLAELANRKRKEAEAAAAETQREKAAKKQRRREGGGKAAAAAIDFGDSDEEDEDFDAGAEAGGDDDDEEVELEAEEGPGGAGAGAEEEDEDEDARERAMQATDADRAFIDDTELAPDQRIDFGDDEEQEDIIAKAQEAAESDDDLDKLFNKGRRRGGPGEERPAYETKLFVDNFLAEMEVAVEEDQKDYEAGRPAIHKLRMLHRVEEILSTKRLHSELLDGGLLGVLKAWLEPLTDGTLPNSKVRSAILRLLGTLPVDCAQEDRKEQLKRSGLGRVVMFLYKVPDETPANRRMAKELIERWSRPILAPRAGGGLGAEEQARILAARQARQARAVAEATAAGGRGGEGGDGDDEGDAPAALKPSDPGFRWHAAVPQAASLDYVRLPASQYAMPDKKQGGGKDRGQHKLSKKLDTLQKKGKLKGRAANVSVEGRNVTIQH